MKHLVFKYLKIVYRFLSISWQREMAYKVNFIIFLVIDSVLFIVQLLAINIYLSYYDTFLGYTKPEMIFLSGLGILNIGLFWSIFHNLNQIPSNVTEGELDRYLLKPINAVFLTAVNEFDIDNLFTSVWGVIFILLSSPNINIIYNTQTFGFLILSEIFLFISIFGFIWATMSLSFWLGNIDNFFWVFDSLTDLKKYPFSSYKGIFFVLFVILCPIALFSSVQLDIVTGRISNITMLILLGVTVFWFFIARFVWKLGLKQYTSASGGGHALG